MTDRNPVFDHAKAILIWLVVLCHVLIYANPDWTIRPYNYGITFISIFHMPAFFLLSGVLFNAEKWMRNGWKAFLLKRTSSFLIPYVIFETIGTLYKHFVLKTVSLADGLRNLVLIRCNVGADWFLPAMFLAQLFAGLSFCFLSKKARIGLAVGTLALLTVCYRFHVLPDTSDLPGGWCATLWRALLGYVFLIAGHWLKPVFQVSLKSRRQMLIATSVCAADLILCAVISLKFGGNDFFTCTLSHPLVFLAGGIAGLDAVLLIGSRIHSRLMRWMGKNSLIIMGTHQLVLYTVQPRTSFLWVGGMMLLLFAMEVLLLFTLDRVKNSFSATGRMHHGY